MYVQFKYNLHDYLPKYIAEMSLGFQIWGGADSNRLYIYILSLFLNPQIRKGGGGALMPPQPAL